MRIDEFDNTMIPDTTDVDNLLSYLKEQRTIPRELELAILRVAYHELKLPYEKTNDVDRLLSNLPRPFVHEVVYTIKNMFKKDTKESVSYDNKHLAYLLYYLPVNVYKIWKPLIDLFLYGNLKSEINLLDIGTGPGTVAVGTIEFFRMLAEKFPQIPFKLNICLVDAQSTFLNIAKNLVVLMAKNVPSNLSVTVHCHSLQMITTHLMLSNSHHKFDAITASNFFHYNEGKNVQDSINLITFLEDWIEDDGSIIIIEPGDNDACKHLKKIRNGALTQANLNLYSPCNGVWSQKDSYSCTCFGMTRSHMKVSRINDYLIKQGIKKAPRESVPFNYIVLRKDGRIKYQPVKNKQHYIEIAQLHDRVGKIVNLKANIRTVIEGSSTIKMYLCDGTCEFFDRKDEVMLSMDIDDWMKIGMDSFLLSGERMTLKRVLVKKRLNGYQLMPQDNTSIKVDY